jgi:hypothetical protein
VAGDERSDDVLSEREERIWDDIVRDHPAGFREPLPAAVVGGGWGAVLLLLFGVPHGALVVGAATFLVWVVWRFAPQQPPAVAADHRAADQQSADSGARPVRHAPADP